MCLPFTRCHNCVRECKTFSSLDASTLALASGADKLLRCRTVVKNHLLALRWMNPNAVIYLRENHGQGTPKVDYHLWTSAEPKSFEILGKLSPEEVVAKVMMAARDPFLPEETGSSAATSASPAPHVSAAHTSTSSGSATATARRAFSTSTSTYLSTTMQ
jgi:hypothetical protein